MDGARVYFFYENQRGRIPKKLLALCLGMRDLFRNYPEELTEKAILSKREYGRVHKALEKLLKYDVDTLVGTKKFARKTDEIFIFKLNSKNNPRLYLTDYFSDRYVLLHGLKKKKYEEDPQDLETAKDRLEELLDRAD